MNINHPTACDIPALRELWKEAFGDTDQYLDTFFSLAFAPDRCLCIDGGKAACHWLNTTCRGEKIAYLYAVATAKSARGQGLCRALLTQVQSVLSARGYAGILLVPQKESLRPMYRKLGFQEATALHEFSTTANEGPLLEGAVSEADLGSNSLRPCGAPISRGELATGKLFIKNPLCSATPSKREAFRQLTAAEYAQARKALLPDGSAIEGEECFRFMATQLRFYCWGDTLFACGREGEHLFIPELLGDASPAEEITAALGAAHATVRTPGSSKKWAMYCPLSNNPAPTHFSFAME